MSKKKILTIVGSVLCLLLIICLFLPFVQYAGKSVSLWDNYGDKNITRVIVLIELLIGVIMFGLEFMGIFKGSKYSLLGVGYSLTLYISSLYSALKDSMLDKLAFGFWFGFILSVAVIVIIVVNDFLTDESQDNNGQYSQQPQNYYNQMPGQQVPYGYNQVPNQPPYGYNSNNNNQMYR